LEWRIQAKKNNDPRQIWNIQGNHVVQVDGKEGVAMSNVQQTSIDAYHSVKADLGRKQKVVLKQLEDATRNGYDMTDMELGKALHWPVNTITPRRGELVSLGLVVEACVRVNVTGRRAKAWRTRT
jgi:phosphoenolpyruvate-protein kinase (PTS system EI component)